ncbi:MAG: hypothetical protein NC040_05995 [Muribaculaceae bacterium]|nr:hypothetical protein [Alistipes senegalensis]MCM1473588.1 hypothetical protein [Muribaculaceae bacterium]
MENSLNKDFWEKFSFSGNVKYSETYLDEDMLQVEYPEKLILDAGFYYDGTFVVYIIWDNNWQSPVAVYSCKTIENFEKIINLAIEQVEKEIIQKRFSYYGKIWETIKIKI